MAAPVGRVILCRVDESILSADRTTGHVRLPGGWRERITDAAVLVTPLVVGGISGATSMDGLRFWYRTLEKPTWNPPDWAFGPVWTTLYLMMGIALVQVWHARRDGRRRRLAQVALGLFALQLALNFGWSWIFFRFHAIGPAFAEIVALLVAILATIAAFARVRPSAAALLVPYLAWTAFASVLNGTIWRLNR
jgi:translocator protein